jgi:hypothetical protein
MPDRRWRERSKAGGPAGRGGCQARPESQGGRDHPGARPAKRAAGKRAKPGQFKDSVLATVKSAGKAGISVKEIAKKLGLDPQRIYAWFNATGKKVKAVRRWPRPRTRGRVERIFVSRWTRAARPGTRPAVLLVCG